MADVTAPVDTAIESAVFRRSTALVRGTGGLKWIGRVVAVAASAYLNRLHRNRYLSTSALSREATATCCPTYRLELVAVSPISGIGARRFEDHLAAVALDVLSLLGDTRWATRSSGDDDQGSTHPTLGRVSSGDAALRSSSAHAGCHGVPRATCNLGQLDHRTKLLRAVKAAWQSFRPPLSSAHG